MTTEKKTTDGSPKRKWRFLSPELREDLELTFNGPTAAIRSTADYSSMPVAPIEDGGMPLPVHGSADPEPAMDSAVGDAARSRRVRRALAWLVEQPNGETMVWDLLEAYVGPVTIRGAAPEGSGVPMTSPDGERFVWKLRSGNIVSAYILKESGPRPEDKVPVYAPMRVLNNPGAILGLVCKEGDGRVDEVFRDALQRACRAYEQAIEETRPAKRRTAVLAEVEAAKERRRQILALSQAEAARLLGVQKPTIRRYIDAGKLKTLKRGKRELIVVIEPEAGDD